MISYKELLLNNRHACSDLKCLCYHYNYADKNEIVKVSKLLKAIKSCILKSDISLNC